MTMWLRLRSATGRLPVIEFTQSPSAAEAISLIAPHENHNNRGSKRPPNKKGRSETLRPGRAQPRQDIESSSLWLRQFGDAH